MSSIEHPSIAYPTGSCVHFPYHAEQFVTSKAFHVALVVLGIISTLALFSAPALSKFQAIGVNTALKITYASASVLMLVVLFSRLFSPEHRKQKEEEVEQRLALRRQQIALKKEALERLPEYLRQNAKKLPPGYFSIQEQPTGLFESNKYALVRSTSIDYVVSYDLSDSAVEAAVKKTVNSGFIQAK